MTSRAVDLTGRRFGALVALSQAPHMYGRVAWNCQCDCGAVKAVTANHLAMGRVSSCGCRFGFVPYNATHRKGGTPEHRSWSAMITRCTNPGREDWSLYGGRGIRVCERWRGRDGFSNFLADMGPRPDGTSLDRVDSNGNYEPGNCRWATAREQGRNTSKVRLSPAIAREIRSLRRSGESTKELATRFGVSRSLIQQVVRGTAWKEAA